jgi:putative ABC transport system ATP-binding protein
MSDTPAAVLRDVHKEYGQGASGVTAIKDINLTIKQGEFVAVIGPSGSGKSTLLHILGCMDVPTSGDVEIDGHPVPKKNDSERTMLRGEKIGFVFQSFHLMGDLTVKENLELPRIFLRRKGGPPLPTPQELLKTVNLPKRLLNRRPNQISGGEAQRVAIARALANNPCILLCDEPTGNLDTANSNSIMQVFDKLWRDGATIVVVTHNPAIAQHAQRRVAMVDGTLAEVP